VTTFLPGGIRENRVKARLAAGEVALGTLSLLPEPGLPEITGAAGMDFFVIDMEHVAVAGQEIAHMTRAAQAAGVTPIVRVRWVEEKTFLWVLDTGVEGLMLPVVEDAATARRIYDLSHFPPDGSRTLCAQSRAAGHGSYRAHLQPYLENANRELLLIALLETPEAVGRVKEIAREPIDVIIVGRGDLSLKMGYPGQPHHPAVVDVTKRTLTAVMEAGRTAGVMVYDIKDGQDWIAFGCRFVIFSEPELIVGQQLSQAVTSLRGQTDRVIASAAR
jgi:2-keto-3-deoxy-L-rhamnonate aldolase RhmA